VCQPFDADGPYDKRYTDVIEPAVADAGLEPYRVDRDPSASIPIDKLEETIRTAAACVVDISTENRNVWYELGYARASRIPLVMICLQNVKPAFDIQHRNIVFYSADAPRDFEQLKTRITERLKAELQLREKEAELSGEFPSPMAKSSGLRPHEIAALALVMQLRADPHDAIGFFQLRRAMENAGLNATATNLAVVQLKRLGLVELREAYDQQANEPYQGLVLTEAGENWLLDHVDELDLVRVG
jgi:hypothetical protein